MKYDISIASDHNGLSFKEEIKEFLESIGYKIIDLGPYSKDSVDYPDYALKVCNSILEEESKYGILICGTGIGMSIAANRHSHIRAALCTNVFMAEMSRAHNNANVIAFGAKLSSLEEMKHMLVKFFDATFEGGRHLQRLSKIR